MVAAGLTGSQLISDLGDAPLSVREQRVEAETGYALSQGPESALDRRSHEQGPCAIASQGIEIAQDPAQRLIVQGAPVGGREYFSHLIIISQTVLPAHRRLLIS